MLYGQYFISAAGWAFLVLGLAGGVRAGAQAAPQAYFRLGTGTQARQLFSPAGRPFRVRAIAGLRLVTPGTPAADLSPAGIDRRAAAILGGLRQLGFNTIGAESDADLWGRGVPYLESLDLAAHLAAEQDEQQQTMVNVFDPDFPAEVRRWVEMACAPRARDSSLIGYLSDETLAWDPATHASEVLAFYLRLPLGSAGRRRADDYLSDRYHSDIGRLDRAWGVRAKDFLALPVPGSANAGFARDAAPFAALVLARYLQTVANAVHAADPHHLFFGAGLEPPPETGPGAAPPPETAATLLWRIPDVVSITLPATAGVGATLRRLRMLTARPVLVRLSGCAPLTAPLRAALAKPQVIGYVWSDIRIRSLPGAGPRLSPPGPDDGSAICSAPAETSWRQLNAQP